jgi:hypothetical protein
MTKREIESGNVKMVINLIENQFNGSVEDNGEGGRLDILLMAIKANLLNVTLK